MSLEERGRVELFELLEPTIGRDAAVKLVHVLPPAGEPLATAAQLEAVEQRIGARIESLATAIEERFSATDQRVESVRHEVIAEFRGEILAAVSGQTRAVIAAVVTTVLGIAGLAAALAQVF